MTSKGARTKKRGTFAWALWDWAEQPYPTIMQTFIFPVYLTGTVAQIESQAEVQLGIATAIAGIILALIAPVLGRRSDDNGRRKFWLMFNTYLLVGIMVASFFVKPSAEFFILGLVLYGAGSVIQEAALINYYAMLKSVTTEKNIGRVSGYAWALGYAGGIVLLVISLAGFILASTPWLGIGKEDAVNVRAVFLFSAAWTVIFSIPLMLRVPEIAKNPNARKETIWQSYQSIWAQLKSLRVQAPETLKFLISSAIYRDGLAGVFTFGAVLGTLAFGFSFEDVIIFGIAANIVSGIGAVIGGRLDDIFGSRTIIIASLVGLIFSGSAVFFFYDYGVITYWIGGLALCLFVGPAQASSRTFVSRFTPAGREGEVFGLYQFTGRAVSFMSGTFWALSITIANNLLGVKNATIWGIWGLMLILVVGLFLLTRVHPRPTVLESN
ncbi:MAG: MFS transporter [Rhodoluna sp.]|nr:MFS transporter [Rhodoluna sp.]